MKQETADVKNEKSTQPEKNEHHSENQQHEWTCFLRIELARERDCRQVIGAAMIVNRCSSGEMGFALAISGGLPPPPPM
jgi:hypothetical protein